MKTLYKKLLIALLLLPFTVLAQNTLTGNVKDMASGQPIPGVNVIVQGTTNGATTDFDGNFTLSKLKKGDVIEISFVGYKTTNITYNAQKTLQVNLEEEATKLDEVVLIGYGTIKKKDATGSVALITSKDFNQGANVTADNLLQGKVAGVTINSGGGSPGSIPTIRIRGGSSLLASNDPLVVVDGLPMDMSVLASLNPNDIDSFSILKDASATAIYGVRASNGVIIIATKKGSKKLQVDYNFQYGSGKNYNKIDIFSADEYRSLINQVGTPSQISKLGTANTDWQDEIYRRTDFVDNNLSLRGNLFKAIPSRLTIGNTYQEGLRLTDHLNRSTVSVNLSPSMFKDHLKLRIAANYTNTKRRNAPGVEGSAILFDPTQPVYDANSPFDGFFEYRTGNTTSSFAPIATINPVAQLLQTNSQDTNNRIYGNFELDYKFHFFPELRAVVNVGYDRSSGNNRTLIDKNARSGPINLGVPIGNDSYSDGVGLNKSFDSYFVYAKNFNKLKLDLTSGYSYQRFESNSYITRNRYLITDKPQSYVGQTRVFVGFFARTNLNINEKYLLTLSYRRDGTSRFGEDNRWGNFPSVAFAWKIKEDFFKGNNVISDLKLRLGWGITGQQEINSGLFYLPQYSQGNQFSQYNFGGQYSPVGVPQSYGPVKWEQTYTYNVGLDFGIANRLNGTVDAYYKKSYDLFQTAPFADGSNFGNEGPQNVGDMHVKGVELGLDYDVIKNDNVKWNVAVNATKFERRIDVIASGQPIYLGTTNAGTGGTSQIHQEGFTPGSFYVYKQLYNLDGSPIEGAFADLNGDGIINLQDRYIYKNPDPDFVLGFNSSFNYKSIDFSFNLRANVGNRVLNTNRSTKSYYSQLQNGVLQNQSTYLLTTQFVNQNNETVLSDMFVENASFIRMDFATLGYTFSKWLDGKASLRLFTGVQNPFIVTKYSGLDPEINGGNDTTIYPRQRQFLFGANVKF